MKDYDIDICVKAVVKNNDKLLIVQRSKNDLIGAGKWEFPGGRIEKDESCEDALNRELFEELSVQLINCELLYVSNFWISDTTKMFALTYSAEIYGNIKLSFEHIDFAWVSIDEAKNIVIPNVITDYNKYIISHS